MFINLFQHKYDVTEALNYPSCSEHLLATAKDQCVWFMVHFYSIKGFMWFNKMMQPAGMGLVFQHFISVQQNWIYGKTDNNYNLSVSKTFTMSEIYFQKGINFISVFESRTLVSMSRIMHNYKMLQYLFYKVI